MSVGPMGPLGSVAGAPLAQGQGSEVTKAQQDTADQSRHVKLTEKAVQAEGVGQTDQDEQASDRDADGRRPWEGPAAPDANAGTGDESTEEPAAHEPRSKDPTGTRGSHLDLTG